MKDVVLIPAWRRAEMLWHTTHCIRAAIGADQLHYIFRFDRGHHAELYEVIKDFPFSHEIAETPRSSYQQTKQSYSVLSGYQLATERTNGLIFLIEEDIFIATDFFRWHQAIHEEHPELFCSIGVENHNRWMRDEGHPEDYYLSALDYCSWGVCWRADVLRRFVLPHACAPYYVKPGDYIRKQFPGSPIGNGYVEQDGLIRRIQWKLGRNHPIAYPYRGRAYHAGAYGYNRANQPSGTLQERIDLVSSFAYSTEAMRTFAARPEWAEDSRPIDLNAPLWQELRLKSLDESRNGLKL